MGILKNGFSARSRRHEQDKKRSQVLDMPRFLFLLIPWPRTEILISQDTLATKQRFSAGQICLALAISLFFPGSWAGAATTGTRVAVSDFNVSAHGAEGLPSGTIAADMLTRELVRSHRVRVVERKLIKKILAEKKLAMAGITSGDATTAGDLSGVDYIIGGNLVANDDGRELTARLVSTSTGMIAATETIDFDKNDDQGLVFRNLAAMLEHNFTAAGAFSGRQEARGRWEPYASKKSQSHFEADGTNGAWAYEIRQGDDEYAGLSFYPEIHRIRNRRLLITCRAENGYPVYLRFYSFVPGFSREDDEDSLVPVEKLVAITTVTTEVEASYHDMRVPEWWRRENHTPKVRFNPDDLRQIELGATEATEGSKKDEIEILRVALQKQP